MTSNGLTTLVDLVVKAGLADALSGPGPFTVFAPTNDAFAALAPSVVSRIVGDADLLKKILIYHVAATALQPTSLQNEASVSTLSGGKLRINQYSGVGFTGAIFQFNRYTSND